MVLGVGIRLRLWGGYAGNNLRKHIMKWGAYKVGGSSACGLLESVTLLHMLLQECLSLKLTHRSPANLRRRCQQHDT